MPKQGYAWLPLLAALSVATVLVSSWHSLWQQQQRLQAVYHWRVNLLQLQQAQRQYFHRHGDFATSEQQLVSAGLLAGVLQWPFATAWQFNAQPARQSLLMHTDLHQAPLRLLMQDFNSYLWQPPRLTVKVVGYAAD